MARRRAKPDPNKYPPGLDARAVKGIISHYDNQPESEAIAEADSAWHNARFTLVRVPNALVAEVERLIEHRTSPTRSGGSARKKTA